MLTILVFAPLAFGLLALATPRARPVLTRGVAAAGALVALGVYLAAALAYDPGRGGLQLREQVAWVPSLRATYDLAIDGLSLATAGIAVVLFAAVALFVPLRRERARIHAFLFLLMETGLLGVFCAQDLLLFYLFFEVALVPMYFVIGLFGHERRRYAAIKFFLYTRVASLAMLLSFLALYLATDPHTFSLEAIAAARPFAAAPARGAWVLLGLVLGFGVKLPTVPLHNWLPDAHVEAPTEGSVILAGVQLKMGAYGLWRVLLPVVPEAAARFGWVLATLGLASIVYGSLAAMAQRDLKRLVAFTSVNHMGFVLLAAAVAALATDPATRALAESGAVYQIVSHGLLTGGLFFLVGILQDWAHTRAIDRFGGLMGRAPGIALVLGVLAFGSLGLPGLSGFVAELQVVAAALRVSAAAAVIAVVGVAITTALFVVLLGRMVMGRPTDLPPLGPVRRQLVTVAALAVLSIWLGVMPGPFVGLFQTRQTVAAAAAP